MKDIFLRHEKKKEKKIKAMNTCKFKKISEIGGIVGSWDKGFSKCHLIYLFTFRT